MRPKQIPSLVLCALLLYGFTFQNGLISFISAPLPTVQSQAARESKLYFVHFTANWCMPCQWMDEHTYRDVTLADYVHRYYLPVKLNVDHPEGSAYRQQYEIKSLPTILIFNANGKLLDRYEESLDAARMLQILQTHNQPANRQGATLLRPSPPKPRVDPEVVATQRPVANESAGIRPTYTPSRPDYQRLPAATPEKTTLSPETPYTIQVGAYGDYNNAAARARQIEQQIREPVSIHHTRQHQRSIYRVMIGRFASETAASNYLLRIRQFKVDGFVKDTRGW